MIERICVYCGSRPGNREPYAREAGRLGSLLADQQIELVYGGASVGIMGILAENVLKSGGRVTGVIPEDLVRKEVAHHALSELIVVSSMHERKARMAELSDGFIALPGGLGTLEELFEMLTWGQLGFHRKPIGILNVEGYFDHLISMLDHQVAEGFVREENRGMLMVHDEPEALLNRFRNYGPPDAEKWIDRSGT